MTLRELIDLREDAVALREEMAQAELRRARGLPAPLDVAALVRAHRLATSGEGLAQACEALEDAKTAGRSARLASLRDFLVRVRAMALEPRAAQELWSFPARPSVMLPGDPGLHGALAPLLVERDLPFEASRDRRADMEDGLAGAERQVAGARSAAWEAAEAALSELRAGEPIEAAWSLQERGWAEPAPPVEPDRNAPPLPPGFVPAPPAPPKDPLTQACEQFLATTDGVARDLGGWILQRYAGASTSDVSLHDIQRLIFAPRFASAFPRDEMLRTCRRWADQLRVDLFAAGCIRIEDADAPLKPLAGRAVAVDPPHEVRVCFLPLEGPGALSALLSAFGAAFLRAGPPPDAPPEDLWFSERGLDHACEALFALLLLDPRWTKRCAGTDLSLDDERALAVARLFEARIRAARALASREAHVAGSLARATTTSRELFQRACRAALPAGLALRDLDPWLDSFAELRGWAFAASAWGHLRERYDEDFWRNPRAGAAIQGLFARGGRPTLRELWSEIDAAPSVAPLAALLLEACA
ncbi:MAG: hypothetical protein ACJ79U_14705 [Myxococcales bacterium]